MLIGGDDIITLGTSFSTFFLHSRSFPLGADKRKSVHEPKWFPTPNDPPIFSHTTWNDLRGIIRVEWENISISGIRLKRFNCVFRLIRNAKFFGYKREIFSKWLIDCTKLFSVRMIAWNYFFHNNVEVVIPDRRNCSAKMLPVSSQSRRSLFRWTFYRKISRIQQCRAGPRALQMWFYSNLLFEERHFGPV